MTASLRALIAGALATLSLPALAESEAAIERLAEGLQVNGRDMPVERIEATPLEGFFEVRLATGERFYTDSEGDYFLVGDLYENAEGGLVNLSEQARNAERAERLAAIPDAERVIFRGTDEPKARITVFTDTTCPYCRRLHEEVPRLNEMGIRVDYLAFPRGGMRSPGARELERVWCAANPAEAMAAAKREESFEGDAACDNPVEDQYHLGMELGVQGTPAIVLPDGRLVPGYVPAERLAAMLGLNDQ
ncbi:DsbC family protein [Halomonas koreensis]|uniref:Thiol:disulfide interchange protein n=1 Tax=Halomonas koreensis TaxID=245385 RepID=A0ABU1G6I2_9GAMM|nr:DsbC family protein [Halomonas koreensis]MDR5868558.1 DsbC family protein [Halomonas koreensis]